MMRPAEHPGRVAAAADGLAVLFAALTLLLLIGGSSHGVLGGVVMSIDWRHAAFGALAVAAIRHAALPRPSIAASAARWADAIRRRPAVRDALLAFGLTRPTVVLVGILAATTVGPAPAGSDSIGPRDRGEALAARWDAQWYASIAAEGYEWQHSFRAQQNLAFFPAYPMLVRGAGLLTGALRSGVPPDRRIARLAWCGLGISLAAFLWAAWYFSQLAREILGDARARHAVMLLAAYPFALFFSAAYTESLFLLAALGAWFHFRRGDTWRTIAWGLLAGLTRPNGCFLSVPLGLLALGIRDAPGGAAAPEATVAWRMKRMILAGMPMAGMLLFTVYQYRMTGVWFAWEKTHAAWGRVLGGGAPLSMVGTFDGLGSGGLLGLAVAHPYDTLNALGLLFALALVRPVWRLSPAWAVFVLVGVLVPFSAGGLMSMGRLTATLFPLFLACAALLPVGVGAGVATAFALLQGLLAALFYTWRDVY